VVALLLTHPAAARPWVPGELQHILDMPCVPPCTLCHDPPQGGGPADKPFGLTIQGAGFFPSAHDSADSDNALKAALTMLEGNPAMNIPPQDSDEDGVPDVTELRNGTDPNRAGVGICGPTYGCVRVAARGRIDDVGVAASFAVIALGGLARRRRGVSCDRKSSPGL
jgi:hypothetical protein